jgi:hypothetical protein
LTFICNTAFSLRITKSYCQISLISVSYVIVTFLFSLEYAGFFKQLTAEKLSMFEKLQLSLEQNEM